MLQHIKEFYRNDNIDKVNLAIMNRDYEMDLVEYVLGCFKSISYVLKEIEMVDYEYIIDADKINQTDYERTRSNKRKDKEQKYTFINESRLGELKMYFRVSLEDGTVSPYTVKMLLPVPDSNQYYQIKGKRYISQYQLVETSTYTTNTALITKSLMPISITRKIVTIEDTKQDEYKMNNYEIYVFNKPTSVMYFYLCTLGWDKSLEYLSLDKYIKLVDSAPVSDEFIYFKINNNIFLRVREVSLSNEYIQGMVGTIMSILTRKMSLEDIYSTDYWTERLGSIKTNSTKASYIEMGSRCLILFNRMLDKPTRDVLRLTHRNKSDIYAVVRWMLQNYNALRKKDNLDLVNKRLRCNEYIATLLNGIISDKIKTFVYKNINMDINPKDEADREKKEEEIKKKIAKKYDKLFNFRGSEIITKLHSSGLIKYNDTVNDSDFFSKFKVTTKGPNSLGNKNSKNISSKQRAIYPSYINRLDLNFCSSSDPGLTNYLTPLCKTEGLYFEGVAPEPEEFEYNFMCEMEGIDPSQDVIQIDPVAFNDVLEFVTDISIRKREVCEQPEDTI